MGKMHADEVDIDSSLVVRLLAVQFPQWAHLPLTPVPSAGTDNAIYRLGDDLAVRLPRVAGATGQVDIEYRWLPRLAPHLPLAIPVPLARGRGWALSIGLIALPYYQHTNPVFATTARQMIAQVLVDHRHAP